MKKNFIISLFLVFYIITSYALEMSDLSVGDFSLIQESTGKIFNFYDPLDRLFEITGFKNNLSEKKYNELGFIKNDIFFIRYLKNTKSYTVEYKNSQGRKIDLPASYYSGRLVVYKDFKTIRNIGIGSQLEDILAKYTNCYIGYTNLNDNERINDDSFIIWDDSMILYKGQKELFDKNNKINCVFMVVELREFDRLLDLSVCDGIYYVLKFNLDENRKVKSIKFSRVPYLP